MARRRFIIIVIAALLCSGAAIWLILPTPPPSYKGRDWREWVGVWGYAPQDAEEALKHIGRENLGFFVERLRGPSRIPSKSELYRIPSIARWMERRMWQNQEEANAAYAIFKVLGADASPALPQLVGILKTETNRDVLSITALSLPTIGKPAVPAFREVFACKNADGRQNAMWILNTEGRLHPEFAELVPDLVQATKNSDEVFAQLAVQALGEMSFQPDIAIPGLINSLGSTNRLIVRDALHSLSNYGPLASNAVPLIEAKLTDPGAEVREAATNASTRLKAALN